MIEYDLFRLHSHFWKLDKQQTFSHPATRMYFYIIELFNSQGQGRMWPDKVQITDPAMSLGVNIKDKKTLWDTRQALVDRGLIQAHKPGHGKRDGVTYELLVGRKDSRENPPSLAADPAKDSRHFLPSFATEGQKDSRENLPSFPTGPQKMEEKMVGKTDHFPIYIGNHTQTTSSSTGAEGEPDQDFFTPFDAEEIPPAPPVAPAPPAPQNWGDGTLAELCRQHSRNNPKTYERAMYIEFLDWYTSPILEPYAKHPDDVGKELWKTYRTGFPLAAMLKKWLPGYERDKAKKANEKPATSHNETPGVGPNYRRTSAGNRKPGKIAPIITANDLVITSPFGGGADSGGNRHTIGLDVDGNSNAA